MRTLVGNNTVYNGRDEIVGFACAICGRVVSSMWGDTCNKCRDEERKHQELLEALKNKQEAK